jgi:hypothetical protein
VPRSAVGVFAAWRVSLRQKQSHVSSPAPKARKAEPGPFKRCGAPDFEPTSPSPCENAVEPPTVRAGIACTALELLQVQHDYPAATVTRDLAATQRTRRVSWELTRWC